MHTAAQIQGIVSYLPGKGHGNIGYRVMIITIFSGASFFCDLKAQSPGNVSQPAIEQHLESMTENSEGVETEDDAFLQSMRRFIQNPIKLNTADIETLKDLLICSPLQLEQIIIYRRLFGNFISIYELQAVPGLDLATIEKLRPYVTVSITENMVPSITARLQGGNHAILARVTQLIEKQKGLKPDPTTGTRKYPGSRQRLFVRYKYQFKNLLQYGLVGEKDAGEQFFKGRQRSGFDFYSAHFFARSIGMIKFLAIGDFTINLGQGLIQWQSLAFKKGAEVTTIKRQLSVLQPYNSSGEVNFHRGIGITLAKRHIEATLFISHRRIDANFMADSLSNEEYVSSLQTSGLHRTNNEINDKGIQRQLAAGGNIAYQAERLHLGINGMYYLFKLPIRKSGDPYNLYALSGSRLGNYSIDYSYRYKNCHFFGEAAITHRFEKAFVQGLIVSLDSKVSMSLLYRNMAPGYQSLYSNAFTENTFPTNEHGLYAGISIQATGKWKIDAYADFYKFPWLKYLVNAPSAGTDYLVQVSFKPSKRSDTYLRYRTSTKTKNDAVGDLVLSPVLPKPRQDLRWHFNQKISGNCIMRNRVDLVWCDRKGVNAQKGFLAYADFMLKPPMKKYATGLRLQYFNTGGYDSRLYAYENDVLYNFSIPVFYDKGYRYYVNINYDINKKATIWLRWAQTIYEGKSAIGTGLDEIEGNKRTEVKFQVRYQF